MSLLIDLTKTSRYYDKRLFPDTIHVQKIECQGYGVAECCLAVSCLTLVG